MTRFGDVLRLHVAALVAVSGSLVVTNAAESSSADAAADRSLWHTTSRIVRRRAYFVRLTKAAQQCCGELLRFLVAQRPVILVAVHLRPGYVEPSQPLLNTLRSVHHRSRSGASSLPLQQDRGQFVGAEARHLAWRQPQRCLRPTQHPRQRRLGDRAALGGEAQRGRGRQRREDRQQQRIEMQVGRRCDQPDRRWDAGPRAERAVEVRQPAPQRGRVIGMATP